MAVPLSPVASAHFSNLSPSSITRNNNNFVPSPIYCTPSPKRPARTTRNTVHWDKNIYDPSIKENAVPDGRNDSPSSNASGTGSLRTLNPSQHFPSDLGDRKFRGHQRRTPLDSETFIAPDTPVDSVDSTPPTSKDYHLHDLVKAARNLDPNENVFEKHRKKQFQWVLSLPASTASSCDQSLDSHLGYTASRISSEGNKRYFGCNLLAWTQSSGKENQLPGDPEDKYLLLATPIVLSQDRIDTPNGVLQQDTQHLQMAATQVTGSPASAARNFDPKGVTPQSAQSAQSAMWSTATIGDASEDNDNTLTLDPRRETDAPLSASEESLEELDQFDDEVEALAAATRKTHITDPQEQRPRSSEKYMSSPKTATKTTPPANISSPKAHGSTRNKTSEPTRSSPVHKASRLAEPEDSDKMPAKAAPTRKVARPASLAPPKPLHKANKPPTISTFELPGEKVARELKERKAARLSMQLESQKLGELTSPPPRTRSIRSSKPPTVPNFELPGDTYTRMAKERLAARLKAEEEEAVRRRQFKARPPPGSATSSSATVRSTFTSRQRESQAGPPPEKGTFSPVSPSPKATATKRQSVVTMTPSLARAASTASVSSSVSAAQRGRTSSTGSSQPSNHTRATSSVSNGSAMSGGGGARQQQQQGRGNVTAEERQRQKARGRSILNRESTAGQDKEREARERQQAVALARQKYAEQSRLLAASRRMKQQSSTGSTASESRVD